MKLAGGVQNAARKTYGSLTSKTGPAGGSNLLSVPGKGPSASSPSGSTAIAGGIASGGDKTPSKKKNGPSTGTTGGSGVKKGETGSSKATAGSVGSSQGTAGSNQPNGLSKQPGSSLGVPSSSDFNKRHSVLVTTSS